MSKALREGANAVICASTGNTSASSEAYAALAGLQCIALIPDAAVALGKLAQALVYGAKGIAIQGSFDEALDMVRSKVPPIVKTHFCSDYIKQPELLTLVILALKGNIGFPIMRIHSRNGLVDYIFT